MARWIEIRLEGGEVFFENGTPFEVGDKVPMGLGSIELRDTSKAGLHVVRLSKSGRFRYSLMLKRNGRYRLGPQRGHRVVEPSEETDPIKRVLRMMDIPVSSLIRATDPTLQVGERWYDNQHCPNGRNTNYWVHDGHATRVNSDTYEQPRGYFSGGGYDTSVIEGASYAVRIDSGRYMNGSRWSRPGQVVVWSHCDPTKLANALAPIVFGVGADAEFVEALNDPEKARRWIDERYERPGCFREQPRCVAFQARGVGKLVDGFSLYASVYNRGVLVTSLPGHSLGAIARLVERHGFGLVDLPSETSELLRATSDKDEARKYLTSRFVVGVLEDGRVQFRNPRDDRFVAAFGPDLSCGYSLQPGSDSELVLLLARVHGVDFLESLVN